MRDDLTLPQALLLLCLDNQTGVSEGIYFQPAIAGAALIELLLLGTIELSDDDPVNVMPLRHYHSLGASLRLCDEQIGRARRPLGLSQWVTQLAHFEGLISTLADELCHMGVLSKARSSVLGIFSRTVWPTVSPILETELKTRLARAMFGEAVPDDRDSALIALAKAVGVLHRNFDLARLTAHGAHIDALTRMDGAQAGPVMRIVQSTTDTLVAAASGGNPLSDTIIT